VNRRDTLKFLAGASMASSLRAQTPPAPNDVQIIDDVIRQLHPGLLRYNSPRQIEQNLARLEREFTGAALPQQYLALSRFLGTLKCGHSYANFYNQSNKVKAALFDRNTRLPFAFRWLGKAMVVTADHSGTGKLTRGMVVHKVNGVSASAILARLMPYARADGNNDAKRRALLGINVRDRYETFDIFHGLICGAPTNGMFQLEVSDATNRRVNIKLPPISLAQRQSFIAPAPKGDAPLWDWRMTPHSVAVLTMDNWSVYKSKWDWEAWLNDRLDSLSGARGLIVDLRQNEGGNDCGDAILSRFARADLKADPVRRLMRYQKTPTALDPFLDTWDSQFRDRGNLVTRHDERFFVERQTGDEYVIRAKGPRIDVPMVVLTSAQNSSATFQFAQRAQAAGLATLIGEPTGGNLRGINGGAFFFVRLPQSGLEFDLPITGFFPMLPMPDAGVMPDIFVPTTLTDVRSGHDAQMARAMAEIARTSAMPA
jgi:Peptidase family S41